MSKSRAKYERTMNMVLGIFWEAILDVGKENEIKFQYPLGLICY